MLLLFILKGIFFVFLIFLFACSAPPKRHRKFPCEGKYETRFELTSEGRDYWCEEVKHP